MWRERVKWAFWSLIAVALLAAIALLERERATVTESRFDSGAGPVSVYHTGPQDARSEGALVIVSHGFAGSRQMMQYISRDLARAGLTVAAFDYIGHGRSTRRLSPDVARIEGTTQQLVAQTDEVVRAVKTRLGHDGPVALLGHSMATDIIIRAARDLPETKAIVAISMYSEAITDRFPQQLLVLSGEWEGRLRDAGLRAVAQLGVEPQEGVTFVQGDVQRRTVSVPGTEHVAVLFSPVTLEETRAWLVAALPGTEAGRTLPRGYHILVVLIALVILIWPMARLLPDRAAAIAPVRRDTFWKALLLPVLPATGAGIFVKGSVMGNAAFAQLLAFLAVWALIALWVMWRAGRRPSVPLWRGLALLLTWALIFALALDRYAAAFLPLGPRLPLMLVLLTGTLPFALADRLLVAGAALWQRILARLLPIAGLAVAMTVSSQSMGLLFTVLPVLVLFFCVYGTMARAVALRTDPGTAGYAQAVVLAWSIAASTPLFAAGPT